MKATKRLIIKSTLSEFKTIDILKVHLMQIHAAIKKINSPQSQTHSKVILISVIYPPTLKILKSQISFIIINKIFLITLINWLNHRWWYQKISKQAISLNLQRIQTRILCLNLFKTLMNISVEMRITQETLAVEYHQLENSLTFVNLLAVRESSISKI